MTCSLRVLRRIIALTVSIARSVSLSLFVCGVCVCAPPYQVRAVFRLFEHLCPRLGRTGLSVLYGHLRDLPPQYEEMHVQLIQRFAEAASGWGAQGGSGERTMASDGRICCAG